MKPSSLEDAIMKKRVKKQPAQEKRRVGTAEIVENPVVARTANTTEPHDVRQPSSSGSPKKSGYTEIPQQTLF